MLHAFDHPVRGEDLDDGFVMLIVPDRSGGLLEIGVVTADPGPVIVHAMPARPKCLREEVGDIDAADDQRDPCARG